MCALVATAAMTDERIRAKMREVAESDPSSAVRAAAKKILQAQPAEADANVADPAESGQPMN